MSRRLVIAVGIAVVVAGAWWLRGRPGAPAASEVPAPLAPEAVRQVRPARGELGELTRVMIDDDPRGTLRLEGQVIDAEDHGVGGATVMITANPPRSITTEADGSFAFDGLVPRPYTLIARARQGVAGPITARLTEKSEPVVLRLRPAGKLTVTVAGGDGKAIRGATVELRGVDVQRAVTQTGPAVFSPVVPGGYQIAAWADGKAHAFQRIQIGTGDAQARLVLSAGAPVAGRVVDDRGAGIADARVRYSGASDWTQQASERYDAVVSAADGSFRFEALPAGSFRFQASHPERAPGSSALITLDGKTPRDGVVIALEVGAVVKGKVVDGQRRPVAAARVRIGGGSGGPGGVGGRGGPGGPRGRMFEPPRQSFSDGDGAFEIRGLPRRPLSAVALHDTGASQTVPVDASHGDVTNLVLVLDVTGAISGAVVDPEGQPVEGAQVSAGPSFGGRGGPGPAGFGGGGFDPSQWQLRGRPEDVTDAAGKFTLTGLAAGAQYRLTAAPASRTGPRRGGFRDGAVATTGDSNVRLVVQPDGAVKGRVAFGDGSAPDMFTISVEQNQQSFLGGGGAFALDGIAPGTYQLAVRGPSFQNTAVEVEITSSRTADAGTITVVKGRSIGGVVVADGQPVPDATVYAGRMILGNGSTSAAPGGASGPLAAQFGGGTKTTTTDAAGAFSLSGFGDGDLAIVAEHPAVGRSRALRLPTVMPGQTELTLTLEKYGSLAGTLRQGNQPIGGIAVTCQAVATPGAIYTVLAGSDGAYRFDQLAPDTYKVSATVGNPRNPRAGLKFYSRQIDVPIGQQVTVDLAVDPGTVTLDVAIVPRSGSVGVASTWLASGAITASTETELLLKLAASGQGTSARSASGSGGPVTFTEVATGDYTVCVTPLPAEVRGAGARGYLERHADTLAVFCKPVTVAPSPDTQSTQVPVVVPAYIPDPAGSGSGGTGGSGTGGGGPRPGPGSGGPGSVGPGSP
ncbi:MAG: carboxypeptidase regulatory-like domain-containing protein [Deltaproteobacteria bacterium]|nr:MAG: carboxypeptidase regulatory-like domain-containing protein [Deltaproteobacteria bacterium]